MQLLLWYHNRTAVLTRDMEVLRQYVLIKSHLYYMSQWNDGGGGCRRSETILLSGLDVGHSICKKLRSETFNGALNVLEEQRGICYVMKNIDIYLYTFKYDIYCHTLFQKYNYFALWNACMIESRYSPPCCQCLSGPVWAGQHLSQHQAFCSSHIASPKEQHIFNAFDWNTLSELLFITCSEMFVLYFVVKYILVLPAVLHSMCKCRWTLSILSAIGFQPGTSFRHRNIRNHLQTKWKIFNSTELDYTLSV